MSISRVVGFVLVGLGVVLIIMGVVASQSLADSLSTTFLGRLTEGTLWYFVGGGASVLVGLVLAFGRFSGSRA